ncbi:efflux RND transporter periplasmic adaptor subunit [Oscillatoria sp. CS-180]|uniref:efflux RND transporter periplasmic adaptor subunit n=1 Tax=Oscillatoria sp. CS-180 TaxID=3021720 RepID=UPI00232DE58A|nr:efflux RND transporter periplasmic adaptor subunit [Oscillatoria sp. CS-180]MDB9528282.1 efflux RND transporter periplasmic adaptor subunit [Oscillatoria sp. CS-180]
MEPTTPEDFQSASSAPFKDSDVDIAEPLEAPIRKEQTGLRWIIGSGLVTLLGIGGWLGYRTFLQTPPESIAVVMAPVNRQDLEVSITEAGIVELGGQQTFKAPSDVTVQEVLVEERERVSQGQVLLELRDRRLQQQLDDQLVQNQINQLDLQRQQEVLQERLTRLTDAESRLQDSAELLEQGYISEDDFRIDRRSLEEAQSEVRNAEVEVTKAELRVRQDDINTANLQVQLEDNQIVAPIDAIVLKVDVKPGDGVQREGRLLSIGDPTQETIRLQMTTLNAANVGIGMPVRVSVIGPNPDIFEGRIQRVSPQAVTDQNNSEQSTVEAEAVLNEPSNSLIPGSAVSVDVVLEERQNVLVIPVTALQRDAGNPYVWVKDAEGLAQQREVTVGLETLETIEILSGLQEGDEIVVAVPPETDLVPGSPLTPPETNAPSEREAETSSGQQNSGGN